MMISAREVVRSDESPAIRVVGLTKAFGRSLALRGVDLDVGWGEVLVLFGPNGAGKTTLLRILATLSKATAGEVQIAGLDLRSNGSEIRRQVGVVLHQTFLYDDLTVEENLLFYGRMFEVRDLENRIGTVLRQVGLEHRRHSTVRTLSRGMQQRATIARAILHEPSIMLLDEPDTGLDQEAIDMLRELLLGPAERPRTVVMTTHNLERGLAMGQRVAIIDKGRIVYQGTKEDLAPGELPLLYAQRAGERR